MFHHQTPSHTFQLFHREPSSSYQSRRGVPLTEQYTGTEVVFGCQLTFSVYVRAIAATWFEARRLRPESAGVVADGLPVSEYARRR